MLVPLSKGTGTRIKIIEALLVGVKNNNYQSREVLKLIIEIQNANYYRKEKLLKN